MVADSSLTPRSTSGIWYEDVEENAEWLVAYAGEHVDERGVIRQDGFTVRLLRRH